LGCYTGATQVFRFAGNKARSVRRHLEIIGSLPRRVEPVLVFGTENCETEIHILTDQSHCTAYTKSSEEVRVRPIHRKALLQALAEELPPGTIRFSSRLVSIDIEPAAASGGSSEIAVVQLDDGTVIRAKFNSRHKNIFTEKEAAGEPTKTLHEVTDSLASHMPAEYLEVVRHSDLDNLSWAPLLYRNPWSLLTGRAARGTITVAGDAFHPMTPDMAQGGCSALEDAIVLARALSRAASPAEGVASYVAERRWRVAWMVAGAYISGWVQQGGTNISGIRGYIVKLFRDRIFFRFVFPKIADTMWFNCEDLTPRKEGKDHVE
ncbi:hypothetical protein EJB05_38007, partial [Eragrostis curvula]